MFKRLSAIFIALIMCLSLMTPAFAAPTSDKDTITIQNVEASSSLTAYQIIEPVIDSSSNFVGWKWSSAIEDCKALSNMVTNSTTEVRVQVTSGESTTTNTYKLIKEDGITLDNVQAIFAQGVSILGSAAITNDKFSYADGNYTATASVGSYLISVKPDPNAKELKIYQPMIVSVDYSGTNSAVKGGIADANAVLTIGTSTAYAKSSTVSIDKSVSDVVSVTNPDGAAAKETQRDYSVGDTISYVLTTTIPSYQLGYYDRDTLTFKFTDTMAKSLTYTDNSLKISKPATGESDPVVINPTETSGSGTVDNYIFDKTTNDDGETVISVSFTPAFIAENMGQELVIRYDATLNENATTGYNPNTNTVVLTYTNSPETTSSVDDNYKVYTFSINGTYLITKGEEESQNTFYYQNNFLKTGETGATLVTDTDGNPVKDTITNRYQYTGGLGGAIFTLYASDKTTEIKTGITTDDKGYLQVDGLKQGIYYLVETSAPEGYSLNSTPVEIVIKAEYFSNGNLKSYSITIDGVETESYTLADDYADYESTQLEDQYISIGQGSAPYIFKNLKLSNLPSTGGYGTYAFILVGCVIMAAALTMFVVKRKESK